MLVFISVSRILVSILQQPEAHHTEEAKPVAEEAQAVPVEAEGPSVEESKPETA